MKTTKIHIIIAIIVLAFTLNSCVKDGDFTVPDVTIKEPNITANSSVMAIKTALQQKFKKDKRLIYTFPINKNTPTYLEAYVVSTDATGNFYKKLIIQDKPKNPTAGIEIDLNQTSSNEKFSVGTKVYVLLNGLSVSYNDGQSKWKTNPTDGVAGKYILGMLDGDKVANIPVTMVDKHIVRSAIVAHLVPTPITLGSITEANINTYVTLANAQFEKSQIGKTFSGEPSDNFDGLRNILESSSEKTIPLQTSTFASFKSVVVPQKKGTINFILTKDFKAKIFVGIINTPSDINFTEKRSEFKEPLFKENFESAPKGRITLPGWTNYKEAGSKDWNVYSDASSLGKSARMGAYKSRNNSNIAWLITPSINFDTQTGEVLTFKTSNSFADSSTLKVLISTDWDGTKTNIATATWTSLPATIVSNSTNYKEWKSSGDVDLSHYTGKGYIAFKYSGSKASSNKGTYELDDIIIKSN